MEEILASIRRIISEDDDPSKRAAPPVAAPPPEPLVLKTPAPPTVQPDDDLVFEDDGPEPQAFASAPEAAPTPVEPPRPAARAPIPQANGAAQAYLEPHDPIVSGEAVSAAAGAFTRLAGSLRVSDAPGQTLESIVRELLRPMMKEWLDHHLPAIVEAKVEAELDRISRMSR